MVTNISEKQLEANRRNAQKSTGPRTSEGKRTSSQNALRHALTAQVSIMTDEDRVAHDKFCARIVESLNPEGANETDLAQLIAPDRWRLHRIHAVEDNIFALGFAGPESNVETDHPEVHAAFTHARVFISNPQQFQLLTLYAQRTNRDIERNMRQLRELQTERQARYEREIAEAARLKQLADFLTQANGDALPATQSFDVAQLTRPNGFVFSVGEIDAFLVRAHRLKQAELADRHGWNKEKYLRAEGSLAA